MLHIVVAKHGPENCPASVDAVRDKYMPNFARIPEVTGKLGIAMQGSWVDMPGHTAFMVLDAPNAHVVNQMMMELHFMDWNTVDVRPVISMDQAAATAQQRDI